MRALVIGLGVQGKKRLSVAGPDAVGSVDPVAPGATYRSIDQAPLDTFDAALVCTPDAPKLGLLRYLIEHGKHALVEKPLVASDDRDLRGLEALSRRTGAACYTAYNHRFEPHIVSMKRALDAGRIGRVYQAGLFYGNGTARIVRDSLWRDQGMGVVPDLASHMLDMCEFLFGRPSSQPELWCCSRFENAAPDYFVLGYPHNAPVLKLEGTLLSWRNTFRLDVLGEEGSAHVFGLCKWGPSSFVLRRRVLPSGKPLEEAIVLEQTDPTWAAEYDHFKSLCRTGGTNIATDIWISDVLNEVAQRMSPGMSA